MNTYSKMFFLFIILILSTFMVINPRETVSAASGGFKVWYSIILPALLPFFIVAELLVSLRFVDFLGVILEPVMRPFFKLPGSSALVVAMGFTSGFPMGAVLSKKLYEDKVLTADEAERLVSFTNNSSPLFIIAAVGVGMFASPVLGYLLAFSHYSSNLLVGIIWGFRATQPLVKKKNTHDIFKEAWQTLVQGLNCNTHGVGKLLAESIKNSLNNILAIAGFIIIFSVITRMFSVWGIMNILAMILCKIFYIFHLPYTISYGLATGIFEISIGSKAIIASQGEVLYKLLAVSLTLAFSGLSVIAQVMGILADTPVRLSFYLMSRLLQMLLSALISLCTYQFLIKSGYSIPSFAIPGQKIVYSFDAWGFSLTCFALFFAIISFLILFSWLRNNYN
ncbi:MAG: nucleoside recognition domain-containing protein [Syntrophomonas sp.]